MLPFVEKKKRLLCKQFKMYPNNKPWVNKSSIQKKKLIIKHQPLICIYCSSYQGDECRYLEKKNELLNLN